MSKAWDALWVNARLATMAPESKAPYGAVDPGAIAVAEGRIAWVGAMDALPESASRGVPRHEAGGAWITPGLIDCHTHLVYAGAAPRSSSSDSRESPTRRSRAAAVASCRR